MMEEFGILEDHEIQRLNEIKAKLPYDINLDDARYLSHLITITNFRNFANDDSRNIWDFNFFDALQQFDDEDFQ